MAGIPQSLILLTYKGKILLMHKTNGALDKIAHPWCLIGGFPKNKESFENAINRAVKSETGLKIENVECISEFRYYAELTDDNINKIQREEFQLLDFFSLKDLQKLLLSDSTREFIAKCSYLIDKPLPQPVWN